MKLTIVRVQQMSAQDRIDLAKIWSEQALATLTQQLDENHRLYAARFNDRLLAALQLEIRGTQGKIQALQVRDATRRRGVGKYLLEETMAQNPSLAHWWVADDGSADQGVRAALMRACGFHAQSDGWVR